MGRGRVQSREYGLLAAVRRSRTDFRPTASHRWIARLLRHRIGPVRIGTNHEHAYRWS